MQAALRSFVSSIKTKRMDNASLAERLRYYRKVKGLSQEELSKRTNITVRTIQRIEKAAVQPHLNTVKTLATALELEVTDLLPLNDPKEETIKKKWLLLMHATPLLGFFIPLCNVLIPLFLWIHKREDNPVYDQHGVKIINFQITALLLAILSFVSLVTIEKWGFFIFIGTVPVCIGIVIANIVYVLRTEKCYYPFSIPFLRFKKTPMAMTITLFLTLFTLGTMAAQSQEHVVRLDGSTVAKDSITYKIEHLAKEADIQGMAIAIFNNNKAVYRHMAGYKDYPNKMVLTDSTNIYGASFSKAVFSVLVMKLVDEGLIDLDTPLESYLPKKLPEYTPLTRWHDDYSDLLADSRYHKITARMCLAHTTGFPNWRFDEPDRKLRVRNTPGAAYGYSGEGFVYLQVILEKLTGKGLEQLAQDIIFGPLEMHNSSYQWQAAFEKDFAYGHMADGRRYQKDTDNEPRSGSTLETTAGDYIRFMEAVLHQKVLSKASYQELFKPQIRIRSLTHFGSGRLVETDRYDDINLSCALGWIYFETPFGPALTKAGHGNGFQHYSILFPETGDGMMIMTNSDNGESGYKELLNYCIGDTFTPMEWANYIPYK